MPGLLAADRSWRFALKPHNARTMRKKLYRRRKRPGYSFYSHALYGGAVGSGQIVYPPACPPFIRAMNALIA